MAGLYVKNASRWYLPKSIWVKLSGTWRVCKNVYIKHNGSWREMIKTVTLTSNRSNFNLWEHVGRPSQPISLVFNINANVIISSKRPNLPQWCPYTHCYNTRTNVPNTPTAFTVGNFPNGSTIIINNNGYITGGGGYGGAGGNSLAKGYNYNRQYSGSNGGNGGHGLVKGSSRSYDCTLVNTGTIAGGGGGGGGACSYQYYDDTPWVNQTRRTSAGCGGDGAGIEGYSRTQGGNSASNNQQNMYGIDGGKGGVIGEDGQDGQSKVQNIGTNGKGGKAGKAIIKSGISIAVSGNIDGEIG
jgi:hypothetical protein